MTVPANESLADSLVMLSRLIGTDHPQGRKEMREIVERVERDTAGMLATLKALQSKMIEGQPMSWADLQAVSAAINRAENGAALVDQ